MQEQRLNELAHELARELKSEADLSTLSKALLKRTVEAALGAEMETHLGYGKHEASDQGRANPRNGHSKKTLKGAHGEVTIEVPRDRAGEFEPQLVGKYQTRLTEFDDQILALYAKGMSTRDIVAMFEELYGAKVSAGLVSNVTERVMEQVEAWRHRPLDAVYPVVYLDGLVVKVRDTNRIVNKTLYLALGLNMDGEKELLGLWLGDQESAKFWLGCLTELKNRGLNDIFIACVDGLTGFADALEAAYPKTQVQRCIVHQVRNSVRYVAWKDRKAVCKDLRKIYTATNEQEGQQQLQAFAQRWDEKYPMISRSWRTHWVQLAPLYSYAMPIRKVIYTTNAIESLNASIRKAIKNRRLFPTAQAAIKVVFLATQAAAKKWTKPVQDWRSALNQFAILFDERMPQC